ncbi:MAG: arginine deiminase family protein [Paludibacteraceae bacterium]|nr:arginine deiminase family protein [Paludibacteraceae bacterium]
MKHFLSIGLLALVLTACHPCTDNQQQPTGAYPQAEWGTACSVLMHTPGEELYHGVIHPLAGLFEYYFDVELAAKEHQHYMDMLRQNGIQVYEVSDILHQLPIDTLRHLAAEALLYDVSQLSEQDAEALGETYRQSVIEEMSQNDLIKCILHQPHVILRPTSINTGVEATYEDHSLMNLYFTRDQSITTPKGHIICHMNSTQRATETHIIRACYDYLGESPILTIEGDGYLEGGDYIPAGTVAFIGCGMRTNLAGIEQIMRHNAFGHDTVIVVKDHRFWQMQMHLDTYFNIIDKDLCTLVASRLHAQAGEDNFVTADIYAREPDSVAYHLLTADISFVELLQQRGYTIIPIEEADEMHYANNYLTIAPRHIMAVGGQSTELQHALQAQGVTVDWIPLDNLIKGYGAAHCMTQVLHRR